MNHRLSYRLLNFINPDLSIVSGKKVIQNLPERNQRIKQLHLNSTSLPTPCWAAESYLHPCASLWTWSRILRPRRLAESCGTRKNAYNNERRIDLWYHIYIYNYIYIYVSWMLCKKVIHAVHISFAYVLVLWKQVDFEVSIVFAWKFQKVILIFSGLNLC